MTSEEGDDPIALLMFAGLLRDDAPWLYEVVVEAYRAIRDGDQQEAKRTMERFRRMTKALGRGPFMEEFLGSSREAHMMMMELPQMLDRFLHRFETRRLKSAGDDDTLEPEESADQPD